MIDQGGKSELSRCLDQPHFHGLAHASSDSDSQGGFGDKLFFLTTRHTTTASTPRVRFLNAKIASRKGATRGIGFRSEVPAEGFSSGKIENSEQEGGSIGYARVFRARAS